MLGTNMLEDLAETLLAMSGLERKLTHLRHC